MTVASASVAVSTVSSFYVVSGTLPLNSRSYVPRQADKDLLAALLAGEYCFVLNSRQMGKSSLSVRIMAKLNETGIKTVFLDLTKFGGSNVTPEQWYIGLLSETGRALGLRKEFLAYWKENVEYSLVQRYLGALHDVALANMEGRIVLFVDEIDAVKSLSFSTDEFFAAIRECYNRRVQEPEYGRLAFALVGSATASDLIQDTRTSPFNIGKRIELKDFTPEEVLPLAEGIGRSNARNLVQRAFFWTNGHPFLTQALCAAIAADAKVQTSADVDLLVEQMFFEAKARERNVNLADVSNRILSSYLDPGQKEEHRAAILDIYKQVWSKRRVVDDETNRPVAVLKLSGITRSRNGELHVRNRIYEQVFDKAWIAQSMPDAELQRQRAAYRKGLMRAVAVSSVIFVAMGALVFTAIKYARQADTDRINANHAQARDEHGRISLEAMLYASDMNVAQQAWEWGDLDRVRKLIKRNRPDFRRLEDSTFQGRTQGLRKDRRGFEWRYLWRLSQGDERETLHSHTRDVRAVAFSPDRSIVAYGGQDAVITLWNLTSRHEITSLPAGDQIISAAFSPDGKMLVTGGVHGAMTVWNVAQHRKQATLDNHGDEVCSVGFSPDGKMLASGYKSGVAKIWNTARWRAISLKGHARQVNSVAFSPDGTTLATGSDDATIKLWNVAAGKPRASLKAIQGVLSVTFSPTGSTLAAGCINGTIELWSVAAKKRSLALQGHKSLVNCLAFSPDGKTLASGSWDYTVKIWSVADGENLATLRGHTGVVYAVAFSQDGAALMTGSGDHTIILWTMTPRNDSAALIGHKDRVLSIAISPDSKTLMSASEDNTIKQWDLVSRKELTTIPANDQITAMAFSPDGRILACGSLQGTLSIVNVASHQVTIVSRGQGQAVSAMAFSPEGNTFAVGYANGIVRLFDAATRRATVRLDAHKGPVSALTYSPDRTGSTPYSKTLFTIGADGFVKLWSLSAEHLRNSIAITSPRGLAISPDGRILAVSSADGFVNLWNLSSGVPGLPHILIVPSPNGVAFSPDGSTLAIGSFDKTIRLWNVPTYEEWNLAAHQEMLILKGHLAPVLNLAFSPDGNFLASAGWEASVRLWQAPPLSKADAK